MTVPLFAAAFLSFVLTLVGLGGMGLVAGRFIAPPPPPPRFIADTFEFTLAPGWVCDLEETEYVCWKGKPPHEAIAIIAMNRRGPEDNLAAYQEQLRTPKPLDGGALSTILSIDRRTLAGYEWIQAVHLGSEVPNYITIYLATATSRVGVLATFSAHNEEKMRREMEIMMSSLKIHQQGLQDLRALTKG
jgi:hypothetical protein